MTHAALIGSQVDVLRLGLPDPSRPAAELAAMRPGELREVAACTAAIAKLLTTGCADAEPAIGQVTRGWSAVSPAASITRLLQSAEQTSGMLTGHSAAIEAVCAVIERAQAAAHRDVALAVEEIAAHRRNVWFEAAGAVLGVPSLAEDLRLAGIIRSLHSSLSAHVSAVAAAVSFLAAQLAGDPTVGPDSLRAGPEAVLPPDPELNPAHRTDERNRAVLAADLHSGSPDRVLFATSILRALQHAGDSAGTAQLVTYDSAAFHGQGRAAISVGDLTSATNVALLVPGISNSPSAMSGGIDLAADLRKEAKRQAPEEKTAVVAWYGYDIPLSWPMDTATGIGTVVLDTWAAASAVNAVAAAPELAADLAAVKAMSQTSARLTVLGFSMGSTAVSEAARYPIPANAIVLLGSPGAGWDTDSAAGYRSVPAAKVFVLSYDQDPVTRPVVDRLASAFGGTDPYGPDPATRGFGGQHIDAATNVPILVGAGLIGALRFLAGDPRHHTMKNYLQGRALTAEGAIVVGHDERVPVKPGR